MYRGVINLSTPGYYVNLCKEELLTLVLQDIKPMYRGVINLSTPGY